ncbi:putative MFS-type transporter YusP [Smittium culicis]|uniref:Putative MFS-type transporter YusP n=1 Tax=Smittium culicis TaxID=133412 RepID=A0A1R1XST1_9FUNG|nr:putative MFS-type transporter YusP [Smittium culicis]
MASSTDLKVDDQAKIDHELTESKTVSISINEKSAVPDDDGIIPMSSKENLFLVLGLAISLFLGALDNTIVSTALPTIANELNSLSQISWVATSYMLSSTALQPLYGKLSDVFGTKMCLIFAIVIFQIGSLISGLAKSVIILIIGRGITGIGGAGLFVLAILVISETIPLKDRGKYMGMFGAVFGLSSIIGPLLGGLFTDKASWRWCFYINLPLGVVSLLSVVFIIKVKPPTGSIKDKLSRIDFFGLLLLVSALVMILLALNWGGNDYAWNSPLVLSLLIVGLLMVAVFVIYEIKFPKEPLIPMKIFKVRNISLILASQFFIGYVMFGIIFYIPIYYNVLHDGSATKAGLFLLPFLLGLVFASIASGQFIARSGVYRPLFWVGTAVLAAGAGLISTFSQNTSSAIHIVYMVIAGLGLGLCMQSMIISAQASSTKEILSMSTTMVAFFRVIGGSIGLAVISAINSSFLSSKIDLFVAKYPEYKEIAEIAINNAKIIYAKSTPEIAKQGILDAYIVALRASFISLIPAAIIGFIFTVFIKHISIKKNKGQSENIVAEV